MLRGCSTRLLTSMCCASHRWKRSDVGQSRIISFDFSTSVEPLTNIENTSNTMFKKLKKHTRFSSNETPDSGLVVLEVVCLWFGRGLVVVWSGLEWFGRGLEWFGVVWSWF